MYDKLQIIVLVAVLAFAALGFVEFVAWLL